MMKRSTVIILIISSILVSSCGGMKHANVPKYIKVYDSSSDAHFTNEQLINMMNQDGGYVPSVVVRNINSDSQSAISSNTNTHKMCSILEMGMAKNNFDVRDRGLFNNVLAGMGNAGVSVDYNQLYEKTHVDLLLEITGYDLDIPYIVDKYYVGDNSYFFPLQEKIVDGKKRKYSPVYKLRGMNITIKVIMLQENLIGGSYSFTYVPCSAESGGGLITSFSPLRYRPSGSSRDVDAYIYDNDEDRKYSSGEKLDILMEAFVSNTVVPKMVAFMKGISYEPVVESFNESDKKPVGQQVSLESKGEDNESVKKTSLTEAIQQTNQQIVSVDMSLPLFNVSSATVSNYRNKLSATGKYSETEIDNMIADQIQENKKILTSEKAPAVASYLQVKEELHVQLLYSVKEKAVAKIKRKLEATDTVLNQLGYVDFNDYSYLAGQNPDSGADADAEGAKEKRNPLSDVRNTINNLRTRNDGTKEEAVSDNTLSAGQPVDRDVRLVNSNDNISLAISDIISLSFHKQSEGELAGLKKNKLDEKKTELAALESDLERLSYLDASLLTEVYKFTSSSVYAVGSEMPASDSDVIMFLCSAPERLVNDALFVFLDGKCVGAGTADLGFYVAFPYASGDNGFHELKIMSCPENGSVCKEMFHSSVKFGVKKHYNFNGVVKSGKLIEIDLL